MVERFSKQVDLVCRGKEILGNKEFLSINPVFRDLTRKTRTKTSIRYAKENDKE